MCPSCAPRADIVVVVAHTGINASSYEAMMENSAWHLAKVKGIDALDAGSRPQELPGTSRICREVDNKAGTLAASRP